VARGDVSREATFSFLNREAPNFFEIVNFRVELRGKWIAGDAPPPVINEGVTKGRRLELEWRVEEISKQKVPVIARSIRSLRKSQKHFPPPRLALPFDKNINMRRECEVHQHRACPMSESSVA
jgi:hypothetical protein